ncbi:hypothetical protein COV06_00305 [Candidatus Uhrbacteria bacterium CG10_big_fil_rev_8_21_14_0_10_50_16]|uniref:Uncharacterized protein n=1 Tax=Candidatus Uhrbacteria bacterium CG10_big_fil_rev_8_21_14_0_10_50_16 TaxID=1975039 RepID=A0A2H0RMR0_9BACT|nr:MAG: hypothetical protein COV06_00305 [Candidatus Uhrbacteria bacterium CG10_big_fil_rev_8_21_14_0_10_50_16]
MSEHPERAPDIVREQSKKERYELTSANGEVIGSVEAEYGTILGDDIDLTYNAHAFDDPSNIVRLQRLTVESADGDKVDIFDLLKADTSKVLIINDYKYVECSHEGVVYIVKPSSLLRLLTTLHELGHLEQIVDEKTASAIEMRKLNATQVGLVEKNELADVFLFFFGLSPNCFKKFSNFFSQHIPIKRRAAHQMSQ